MSIEVRNVSRRFGAFAAVDNVDLRVDSGELVALLGPSGLGQDDAAPHHRRARADRLGIDPFRRRRRHRRQRARAPRRLRVPALRAVPAPHGVREHRLRPARPAAAAATVREGHPRLGAAAADAGPARFAGAALPVAAVRRAAAARGAGPGAGRRAARAAARRAVRRARRQGAQGAAALAAAAARRAARHQPVRHPRPGRGARARRSRGDHEPRQDRAGRQPGRGLRPAGVAVRARLPRRRQRVALPDPGRSRRRRRRAGRRAGRPCAGAGQRQALRPAARGRHRAGVERHAGLPGDHRPRQPGRADRRGSICGRRGATRRASSCRRMPSIACG